MKSTTSLLLAAFLFASFSGQSVSAQKDWLSDLLSNVNNINERVQSDVRNTNEQIQRDIANINSRVQNDVDQIQKNVKSEVERINQQVNEQVSIANRQGEEAVKRGESGPSSTLIVSGNAASSRSINSGVDANGNPYQLESENLVVGRTLFHTDRVYNYTSKVLEERRYTLDLTDPNAKPVYSNVTRTPFN